MNSTLPWRHDGKPLLTRLRDPMLHTCGLSARARGKQRRGLRRACCSLFQASNGCCKTNMDTTKGCPLSNLGTSEGCHVNLHVRGFRVPEPYQHTLKSLFVRCPLFRCGHQQCRSEPLLPCAKEFTRTQTHAPKQTQAQHQQPCS